MTTCFLQLKVNPLTTPSFNNHSPQLAIGFIYFPKICLKVQRIKALGPKPTKSTSRLLRFKGEVKKWTGEEEEEDPISCLRKSVGKLASWCIPTRAWPWLLWSMASAAIAPWETAWVPSSWGRADFATTNAAAAAATTTTVQDRHPHFVAVNTPSGTEPGRSLQASIAFKVSWELRETQ